jgi:hypothetical protein
LALIFKYNLIPQKKNYLLMSFCVEYTLAG